MKMNEAFARRGLPTELLVPLSFGRLLRPELPRAETFWHYGVAPIFAVRYLPVPQAFHVFSVAALLAACTSSRLVYTRKLFLAAALPFFGRPVCFEAHDLRAEIKNPWFVVFLRAVHKRRFVGVICISHRMARALRRLGVPAEKITVAHDGVSLRSSMPAVSKEQARRELGLPLHQFLAAYVGSLHLGRGLGLIVEAAESLPSVSFLVVGGSPVQVAEWQQRTTRAGLRNLTFTGHVPHRSTPLYLKAADVLLMPYTRLLTIKGFTSPLKMFEYMAARRPIVGADLAVLREVLTHEQNALLVPLDDAGALVAALERLRDDAPLCARLAQQGGVDVQGYSWDERARRILSFLDQRLAAIGMALPPCGLVPEPIRS